MRISCSKCSSLYSLSENEMGQLPGSEFRCRKCDSMIRLIYCPSCKAFYAVTYQQAGPDMFNLKCIKCSVIFQMMVRPVINETAESEKKVFKKTFVKAFSEPYKSEAVHSSQSDHVPSISAFIKESFSGKNLFPWIAAVCLMMFSIGVVQLFETRIASGATGSWQKFFGTFSILMPVLIVASVYIFFAAHSFFRDTRKSWANFFCGTMFLISSAMIINFSVLIFSVIPPFSTLVFSTLAFFAYLSVIIASAFAVALVLYFPFCSGWRSFIDTIKSGGVRCIGGLMIFVISASAAFSMAHFLNYSASKLMSILYNFSGLSSSDAQVHFSYSGFGVISNTVSILYLLSADLLHTGSISGAFFYLVIIVFSVITVAASFSVVCSISKKIYFSVKSSTGGFFFNSFLLIGGSAAVLGFAILARKLFF